MTRITSLLLLALFACEPSTEITVAVSDNDYIAGRIGDRAFRLVREYGPAPQPYYQTYNTDSVSVEQGPDEYYLLLRRTDPGLTEMIELAIPLDPLYADAYPIADLRGRLSFADLFEDSSVGCPHPDSNTVVTVPLRITVNEWTDDALSGTFVSLAEKFPGEGEFAFVVEKH